MPINVHPQRPSRSSNRARVSALADHDRPEPDIAADLRPGLEDFLLALRVEAGLSRNTLVAYRGDLLRFLAWATQRGVKSYGEIDAALVVDSLSERRAAGMSPLRSQ